MVSIVTGQGLPGFMSVEIVGKPNKFGSYEVGSLLALEMGSLHCMVDCKVKFKNALVFLQRGAGQQKLTKNKSVFLQPVEAFISVGEWTLTETKLFDSSLVEVGVFSDEIK